MDGPLDPAAVAALTAPVPETIGDGGPELVQMLTPEGERVEHPAVRAVRRRPRRRGPARLLPRPRPDPPRRRRGDRAAAPGRARHLGAACSARRRPRSAPAARCAPGLRLPDLPRARRRLVPRGRPAQPPRPLPRRQPRRLGPEREELPPLHDRHRRPDAARDRLRDGRPARRGGRHRRPRARRRRHRLLRRRRDQPGRRQRGVRLRRGQQRPRGVLLPEQPVGHLRAHRAADPHPALPARPRLRLPRRAGRRQRRPRGLRRDQGGARGRPHRSGARRSSRRSPTGWARTRPPTTRPSTASRPRSRRGSCATRSPGSRPTSTSSGKADQAFFDAVEREADELAAQVRQGCLAMPDPDAARDVRPRLRRGAPARRGGARRVRRLPPPASRGATDDHS